MKTYYLNQLADEQIRELCQRPAINFSSALEATKIIINSVKQQGDKAVKAYTKIFDQVTVEQLAVTTNEIEVAAARTPKNIQQALQTAATNIKKFHTAQLPENISVAIAKGITCFRESRPIEKVGLYIPGGSAPLVSTVLMLGIPAMIAGCNQTILCTPPNQDGNIADSVLYAAKLCNIQQVFKIGGAQAIAAMSYGTESVPRAYKIFGPGNQYVTAAKMLASIDPDGAAVDLPAGPSEVLVIADQDSRADFVASDLLAQAEHGADSQAILVCTDDQTAKAIAVEVERQLANLPRENVARQALNNSFILLVASLTEAINFANEYAPEHLILNVSNPETFISKVKNAGSVFLGAYSCESAGDYASGTNHTLPTYGYAKTHSGVTVESFMKTITFQKLTAEGVRRLAPTVAALAEIEGLAAHKRAIEIRCEENKS